MPRQWCAAKPKIKPTKERGRNLLILFVSSIHQDQKKIDTFILHDMVDSNSLAYDDIVYPRYKDAFL